jgi:hypothetical protein
VVIPAAFAIQNLRILLNSSTPQDPGGLTNSSGLLGRYIIAHSGTDVFRLFTAQTENFPGRTAGQLLSDTYGFPVAQVAHTFGADDLAGYEAGVAEGMAILNSAGTYKVAKQQLI